MSAGTKVDKRFLADVYSVSHAIANALLGAGHSCPTFLYVFEAFSNRNKLVNEARFTRFKYTFFKC